MGLLDKISSILSSKKKDASILVVGLDNSGKSSIINISAQKQKEKDQELRE